MVENQRSRCRFLSISVTLFSNHLNRKYLHHLRQRYQHHQFLSFGVWAWSRFRRIERVLRGWRVCSGHQRGYQFLEVKFRPRKSGVQPGLSSLALSGPDRSECQKLTEVRWAGKNVTEMFVPHNFVSVFLKVGFEFLQTVTESGEDFLDVTTLFHWDNTEMIFFVDPNEEVFGFIVPDTTSVWPVAGLNNTV